MTVPQVPAPQRREGGWWVPAVSPDGSPGWTWQPDPPPPPVAEDPRAPALPASDLPSVPGRGPDVTPGPALLPPPPPGRRRPPSSGAVCVLPAPGTDGTSARGGEGVRRRRDLLLGAAALAVAVCVGILAMAANDDPIVPPVQPVPGAPPQPPTREGAEDVRGEPAAETAQ